VDVVDVSLPHGKYALACYYIIADAEASSNLARYDGVKYGHRSKNASDIRTMYTRTRDEGFGAEVKRRVLLGTYVLSAGYYDAYYLKAQKVRSLVIDDITKAFGHCDLMMLPTSPSVAFEFGEKSDPLMMYLSDIFTIPVNLAGLPGVSIPTGLSEERLPYGVQLVGRPLDEATVLRGARGVETLIGFEERPFG
jgi:aspartyl-tRNA(Asn)/glutamyl-tRNA(Gln) amidotransferase subunit A